MKQDTLERFVSYVDVCESGCWEWTRALDRKGYGQFYLGSAMTGAHRASWQLLVGPIPVGLQIDHLCRNRRCVNPDHLEPVTVAENVSRSHAATGRGRAAAHCVHGHEFTQDNVFLKTDRSGRTRRACRECNRLYLARRRAQKTVAA